MTSLNKLLTQFPLSKINDCYSNSTMFTSHNRTDLQKAIPSLQRFQYIPSFSQLKITIFALVNLYIFISSEPLVLKYRQSFISSNNSSSSFSSSAVIIFLFPFSR